MDFSFADCFQFLEINSVIWITLLVTITIYFYLDIKNKQSLWERKGIPYVKPKFLLGNMELIRSKSFVENVQDLYNAFPGTRYHGTYQFTCPTLIVKDPDLIKQITVKEFDHFLNHRAVVSVEADPFWSKNLFASRDEKWRDLRSTLSPSFTSSKMKIMYTLIDECAQQFLEYFKKEKGEVIELEMKDTLSRYTNDVIATTAFGLQVNSLKDKDNEFFLAGKDATDLGGLRILKFFAFSISPTLFKLLKIKIIPPKVTKYFCKIIEDTVKLRKEKNIVRPDMIHLLIEAQKGRQQHEEDFRINEGFSSVSESELTKNKGKMEITLDDINSQAFVFFLAGFETVSTFLSFTLYELALNRDIQNRLRAEIQSVDGKITYEKLLSLKYLDMVVCESLRKWPPAIVTDREVSKDFVIEPVKANERRLVLEKGLVCWFPVFAIHNDARFYPNPKQFDPERFNDENKHKINPSVYIPFGSGPRNCIGSRFALLEGKLLLAYILKNFEVVKVRRTQEPITFDKKQINMFVEGGLWLGFKKL